MRSYGGRFRFQFGELVVRPLLPNFYWCSSRFLGHRKLGAHTATINQAIQPLCLHATKRLVLEEEGGRLAAGLELFGSGCAVHGGEVPPLPVRAQGVAPRPLLRLASAMSGPTERMALFVHDV